MRNVDSIMKGLSPLLSLPKGWMGPRRVKFEKYIGGGIRRLHRHGGHSVDGRIGGRRSKWPAQGRQSCFRAGEKYDAFTRTNIDFSSGFPAKPVPKQSPACFLLVAYVRQFACHRLLQASSLILGHPIGDPPPAPHTTSFLSRVFRVVSSRLYL